MRDDAPTREAIALPGLFLTVAFLGGLRLSADGSGFRFVPPPVIALVLGMLLVSVLVRGRRLLPLRLMGSHRTSVQNLSGIVVLLTLFGASAQVFNAIAPETGLLHVVFNTFFLVLLWNTLAAGPRAGRLFHSLVVLLGSAFILKYVVLTALYAADGGWTTRIVAALLEGVTLGTLDYEPEAPLAGYLAFGNLVLYLVGLALLPGDSLTTDHGTRPGLEAGPDTRQLEASWE